jgi:hypothetical protein
MTRWLLAAEADQIQDSIFRSSRLREVVGGSQLLTRFCRTYEQRLHAELYRLHLLEENKPGPTIAAAVVICKATYPHTLAYRRGEELLKEAKQLARRLEVDTDTHVSTLNFHLITGNEVGTPIMETSERYRPTACPYFIREDLGETVLQSGKPVQGLLNHRLTLAQAGLPAKRRAEAERLYQYASLPKDDTIPTPSGWPRGTCLATRRWRAGSICLARSGAKMRGAGRRCANSPEWSKPRTPSPCDLAKPGGVVMAWQLYGSNRSPIPH